MLRRTRFHLTLAATFAAASLVLNLLTMSGRWRGRGATMWEVANVVPFILSLFIAGNPHSGSDVVICLLSLLQWGTAGYLLGKLVR